MGVSGNVIGAGMQSDALYFDWNGCFSPVLQCFFSCILVKFSFSRAVAGAGTTWSPHVWVLVDPHLKN